ncbi:YggS family pyridoxal phosphate-dependent enzyme, partial [bacterium]|nr:YggS family pyridoxal phosphate-dependent enzyme [bacterium]
KTRLPQDITWHLIGHLQSNKVKQAVAAASVIESVDTVRLLRIIDAEASAQNRTVSCFLQIHISDEETKSGFSLAEAMETDWGSVAVSLRSARICGVMGMASFTDDMVRVRDEFKTLAGLFRMIRDRHFSESSSFREISMGMSGDWRVAVEEGSTIIRVGTLIFGERIKK